MDIKAYIDQYKTFHAQYIKFFEDIYNYYDYYIQISKNSYTCNDGYTNKIIEICINGVVFILHEEYFCAFNINNITSEQFIEKVNIMLDAKNIIESTINVGDMYQHRYAGQYETRWELIGNVHIKYDCITIFENCSIYFHDSINDYDIHANFNEIHKIIDYITENCPQYLKNQDIKIALKQ